MIHIGFPPRRPLPSGSFCPPGSVTETSCAEGYCCPDTSTQAECPAGAPTLFLPSAFRASKCSHADNRARCTSSFSGLYLNSKLLQHQHSLKTPPQLLPHSCRIVGRAHCRRRNNVGGNCGCPFHGVRIKKDQGKKRGVAARRGDMGRCGNSYP